MCPSVCSSVRSQLIMGAEAFGQFVCVQLGGAVFSVSGGLTGAQWIICLLFGAGEIPWNLLVCCVPADYVPDALLNFDKRLEVRLHCFAARRPLTCERHALLC